MAPEHEIGIEVVPPPHGSRQLLIAAWLIVMTVALAVRLPGVTAFGPLRAARNRIAMEKRDETKDAGTKPPHAQERERPPVDFHDPFSRFDFEPTDGGEF